MKKDKRERVTICKLCKKEFYVCDCYFEDDKDAERNTSSVLLSTFRSYKSKTGKDYKPKRKE